MASTSQYADGTYLGEAVSEPWGTFQVLDEGRVAKDRAAAVTTQYPEERKVYPAGYRGAHRLTLKPDGTWQLESERSPTTEDRERLGIKRGNGMVVTVEVQPGVR